MKYKVGDKVRIIIKDHYCEAAKDKIDNILIDRMTEITDVEGLFSIGCPYTLKYFPGLYWKDEELEKYIEPIFTPIYSRFEILDL